VIASETSANPAQRDDLSIFRVVIGLDALQRDNQAFDERVAERRFEEVSLVPVVLAGKYLPAAEVDNIYTR
jgi:hypothetical protein